MKKHKSNKKKDAQIRNIEKFNILLYSHDTPLVLSPPNSWHDRLNPRAHPTRHRGSPGKLTA